MKTVLTTKKQKRKRIVMTTLAVGAAGILGYFGWQYYKKKKEKKKEEPDSLPKPVNYETPKTVYVDRPVYTTAPKPKSKTTVQTIFQNPFLNIPNTRKDEFPLKRGSKGEKVKALQEALMAKYGKPILPRFGADGDFGPEMAAALKKLKLPATLEQSTYYVLLQGYSGSGGNSGVHNSLAKQLLTAVNKKDFTQTIQLLKQLKTKDDYKSTGDEFKNYRIGGGVRQTLVNGLLNTFKTEEQKQAIRFEFLRMGLQFDGKKWSLDGFDGISLVTIEPATVWVNSRQSIRVPAKMVLGNEVTRRLDYTLFENNGKHFLVQSRSVQSL